MVSEGRKTRLREFFNIKSVGGGQWGMGFYEALDMVARKFEIRPKRAG